MPSNFQEPKPVESKLVKAVETVLNRDFEVSPMYIYTDRDGIKETVRNFIESYGVPVKNMNEIPRKAEMFWEMISHEGVIMIDRNAIEMGARRFGVGLNHLLDLIKLHSLGHVFAGHLYGEKNFRELTTDLIESKKRYKSEGLLGIFKPGAWREASKGAKLLSSIKAIKTSEESFCEYVMLEGSKQISQGNSNYAARVHEMTVKIDKKYGYVNFFYSLVEHNLPAYFPYLSFPLNLPTTFDLKRPRTYIRKNGGTKLEFSV